MKRMIFNILSVAILVALPASASMVRGTVTDSATGLPISNVKVIITQMQGEREEIADSSITGSTGSYSITFSNLSGTGFYIRTIATQHYFHSMSIGSIGINDTITRDIKLKRIPTMVSAASHPTASQSITFRTAGSRLYLSGIKIGAIVGIYNLNGRLLFKTVVPAGTSEVRMPEWIAATGCYQVSISANGCLIRGMVLSGAYSI
jgi:hypothetical protein